MKPYPFFSQINGALAAAELPLLMDPPKREKLRPNPVGELEILNRGGVITLRLRVPRTPAGTRLCWALAGAAAASGPPATASPLSANCPRRWAVGAISPTSTWDAFGKPPVGRRVFIRTRQLINGWQDGFKETCADVPLPEQ
jgi:hypothetical protein